MFGVKGYTLSKEEITIPFSLADMDGYKLLTVKKEDVPQNTDYVNVFREIAKAGEEGYAVLPNNSLYYFDGGQDEERELDRNQMPIAGVIKKDFSFMTLVTSMAYEYHTILERKNDIFNLYFKFLFDGDGASDNIEIRIYDITGEDADYNKIARIYREYILDNKICIPLKERIKDNEALRYAVYAPLVRVRHAWKPCPSPVLEQTPETEPDVYVACDFERTEKISQKFKEHGIKAAEISLVGWNDKGHDGRWPTALPPEEKLGGTDGLKKLIKKVQDDGYHITCHTNSTDAYSISSLWDKEDIIVDKSGEMVKGFAWSGGQMYFVCPEKAYENAKKVLPEVAELGFYGVHYIDVMSSVYPQKCYHKDHPHSIPESIEYYRKIAELTKELFGGFSSEGGRDYAAPFTDYVLYVDGGDECSIKTETVPLWELVYHGIVLYNPWADCMNYTIKDKKTQLMMIEYGGRPSFYFHSRFVTESDTVKNWMGVTDLTSDDERIDYCVSKVKEGCDEYDKISYLQTEFMVRHESENGVNKVWYSDGTVITVDYNKMTYDVKK